MKRTFFTLCGMVLTMATSAQYTLKDWNIRGVDANSELHLNVSEYKLNYNHPLPYADWQKSWVVKADLKCGNVYASDAPGVQPEQMAYSYAESIEGPWTYGGFISTSANHGFTIHPSVIQFKGKWYYIYHDGSYSQNGGPGGDCRRSVCAEYLYFDKEGKIKFIPLTQEGISKRK